MILLSWKFSHMKIVNLLSILVYLDIIKHWTAIAYWSYRKFAINVDHIVVSQHCKSLKAKCIYSREV